MSIRTGWKSHAGDIVLGGVIFTIGLALFLQAQSLAPGPGLFPRFVLALMTATGAGIVALAILAGMRGRPAEAAQADWGRSVGVPAIILIAAGVLLYAIGFYLTSPLLIIAVYLWHCRVANGAVRLWRDPGVALVLAVGATLVLYLVFDRLIGLPAPTGALL
ncbi:tripartite tricarboxylate transporter TctB family protein (plasmid) [Paracoccus liaowanqingii]|uniref:Tripartite tricarboxylate transporter TctB family protein n=1 Tax=Paracoccus liaowanqingii TaxID=2560053 RepID=A0A4Y5SUA0_9RHOB|nr:tripartite tricarboxylate transporter TctB family protein [Paracoccus liaowanqingii]QDA36294.1 tripartite tricarboxylate transporter TctB family protein [Paracoccus liaowanqingii]